MAGGLNIFIMIAVIAYLLYRSFSTPSTGDGEDIIQSPFIV